MSRNPKNQNLSTPCPSKKCGHWNDWVKVTGLGKDLRQWDKPRQCSACGRQLSRDPEIKEHKLGIADHAPQQLLSGASL